MNSSFSAARNTFEPKKRTLPEKNVHAASPVGESYVFENVPTDFTSNTVMLGTEHAVRKLREVIRLHWDCGCSQMAEDKALL